MSNKKVSNSTRQNAVNKDALRQMSDGEFLSNAEYLSEPLYFDYFNAPYCQDVTIDGYLSRTDIDNIVKNRKDPLPSTQNDTTGTRKRTVVTKSCATKNTKNTKGGTGKYIAKRTVALVIILVLAIVLLAVIAIGSAGIDKVSDYVSLYTTNQGAISVFDPVLAAVDKLIDGVDIATVFGNYMDVQGQQELAAVYSVSAAALLYVLFAIIAFIKALCALCTKRGEDGFYKKFKFGFISIVMLLCGVVLLTGGLYAGGSDISGIVDFVKPNAEVFGVGYAWYGLVGIPVIMLICSCLSYKKGKRVKTK